MVSLAKSRNAFIDYPPVLRSNYAKPAPPQARLLLVFLVKPDGKILDRLENAEMLLAGRVRQLWPGDVRKRQFGVRHPVEQIAQQRQPAECLVVAIDQGPGREFGMGRREHHLARLGVLVV